MGILVKPVEFTKRALRDLAKTKKFYQELYGEDRTEKIIEDIFERLATLEDPEIDLMAIGSYDLEFEHLKREYRKINVEHCKITYRIGKLKIYVVRVFDTRQNPKKNL